MRITTPYEGQAAAGWTPGTAVPVPLHLHTATVNEALTDYNDHMSESSFLLVFGDNSDALFRYIGIDETYRASGSSIFTAETHLRHLGELQLGDALTCTTIVCGVDDKRLHVAYEMLDTDGRSVAQIEQMLLHVDGTDGTPRVAPFPQRLREPLDAIRAAHTGYEPDWVGRRIAMPQPK